MECGGGQTPLWLFGGRVFQPAICAKTAGWKTRPPKCPSISGVRSAAAPPQSRWRHPRASVLCMQTRSALSQRWLAWHYCDGLSAVRNDDGSRHVDSHARIADGFAVHAYTQSLRVGWQPTTMCFIRRERDAFGIGPVASI